MAKRAIEKVYPSRTLSADADGYLRLSVPPDIVKDDRFDLDPGSEVELRGIISGEDTHIRLESSE